MKPQLQLQTKKRLRVTFELDITEDGKDDNETLDLARQTAFDLIFLRAKSDILTQQMLCETLPNCDVRIVSIERAAKKRWKADLNAIQSAINSATYHLVNIEGED